MTNDIAPDNIADIRRMLDDISTVDIFLKLALAERSRSGWHLDKAEEYLDKAKEAMKRIQSRK